MSDIRQEIIFPNSGLNFDDDWRWHQPGDSPYRLNILVSDDGQVGTITNMLGNTRTVDISDHELYLSHTYKVIGSYYNRLTRIVYYFVWGHPYEIEGAGASTSSTTTSTTTEAPGGGLDIDYTAGDFQYDNMLLAYYEDSQTLDVIFRDPKNYFGLHYDYPMRDICMIGNWLYFNPRVSEPKMIDVEMAYNYTNYDAYDATIDTYVYGSYVTFYGGLFRANQAIGLGETPSTDADKWDRIGDSYQNESNLFDSEFRYAFSVIKQPPVVRPSLAYGTDENINSNNVRGKMFRFSYRYKYFDNSYSVYSAYSDVSLPTNDETWNGELLEDVNSNNYIAVTVNLHSAALIKSVEIIFQAIGENWRRCKIVNREEQAELTSTNFVYDFYNNEAYEMYADDSIVTKVQDSVPPLANSQEIINKNILCYGGVTEGFDNIPKEDIDVTLTPESEDIVEIFDEANILRDNLVNNDYREEEGGVDDSDPYAQRIYYFVLDVSGYVAWTLNNGDVFRMVVNGAEGIVTLVAGDLVDAEHLVDAIALAVKGSSVWADISHDADGELWIGGYNVTPPVSIAIFYRPAVGVSALSKYRGFKTGAFHPFCIFYYDINLRRCDAQTSKISENTIGYTYAGTTVYIPMFNEISPPLDSSHRWILNWTINHLPPENARYWRWGSAGNTLCSDFVQYIINDIGDEDTEGGLMTWVDISPLQTLKFTTELEDLILWNQFPSSNISPWEWEDGDRIRFLTAEGNQGVPGTDLGTPLDGIYDMEIIKQNIDDNTIYIQRFGHGALNIGECSLVEIYRPIKEVEKEEFHEFGSLMPVIKDGAGVKVHGGIGTSSSQDTSTDTPASGIFNNGDVYHILRTPSKYLDDADTDQGVFHESMWWSDFYDSDDWDKGKTGVESNFGERYLNIIRYSNPYFQNTQINGLPTFEALSYKELNDVFGEIIAIYEVGDTLKVYQERKASSIQMGRIERIDETGQISVSSSSVVLGSIRYSPSNYSTVFPESISRNNKYIYGFDIYNGVMWRDSVNGIFPISGRYAEAGGDSDYKMATWFKDKSKNLLVSGIGHCDVMSAWDEEFKNLHVVFKDYNEELNDVTIVFHEPSNRWICFQDLDQTPTSHNVIVECKEYTIVQGFEGGLGYSFDEDTRFAVFDILTPGNKVFTMPLITMNMTAYEPTVQADSIMDGSLVSVGMTAYTPTVHISYIYGTPNSLSWSADQFGVIVARTVGITNSESDVVINSVPDWIGITDSLGNPLGVGSGVDEEALEIYPIEANGGIEKTDHVMLTDGYGNICDIAVIHLGADTTVDVQINPSDSVGLTVTFVSGANVVGSASVTVTYIPNHPDYSYGQLINIFYTITKNGVYAGLGTESDKDEYSNTNTFTMNSVSTNGDAIIVYIKGEVKIE